MKKQQQTGLSLIGRSPQSGITIYEKNGKRVVRSAFSTPSRRCTRKQFEQRMRMRHSIALWHRLAEFEPMFTEHQSAYSGFISLANTSKGWALVLVRGKRCTTQGLVTNCTFYQQYTTHEVMMKAAEDHSGRKMRIVL